MSSRGKEEEGEKGAGKRTSIMGQRTTMSSGKRKKGEGGLIS